MLLRLRRNIPPESKALAAAYTARLVVCLIWLVFIVYVLVQTVAMILFPGDDFTGERRNWGWTCTIVAVILGLPGFLGAYRLNRKLNDLEEGKDRRGFDVVSREDA